MEINVTSNERLLLQHCLYINLKSRTDRKQHVENQLNSLGIFSSLFPPQRFDAVKHINGAIGCSISHIRCLEIAKKNNWKNVVIVEDDITFLDPDKFQHQLSKFLKYHPRFDVLLLGGNNMPPYKQIDDTCIKVTRCQTTTGYLVQQHYYDTLINNFKEGVQGLIKYPDKGYIYAIDKYWFKLQQKDGWFLLTPLSVIQKPGYSDIEQKETNYYISMLDLDKKTFINNMRNMLKSIHI
jgi:glycosyl transferase family 25